MDLAFLGVLPKSQPPAQSSSIKPPLPPSIPLSSHRTTQPQCLLHACPWAPGALRPPLPVRTRLNGSGRARQLRELPLPLQPHIHQLTQADISISSFPGPAISLPLPGTSQRTHHERPYRLHLQRHPYVYFFHPELHSSAID